MKTPYEVRGAILALLFLDALAWGQNPDLDRYHVIAERLVRAFNAADYDGFRKDFSQTMLEALPLDKTKSLLDSLRVQFGRIQRLGAPKINPARRTVFPAQFERGLLDIQIVLDDWNKIIGLWFRPHTPDIPVPARHHTVLSLPFKGRWLVAWGGDTNVLNVHHGVTNQQYAFDFLGVGEDGKTRRTLGDSQKNEDYHAFGREILAPADGIVTDVIDGVRDCVPGSMNPYSALGNAVFIQHREHEVSVLAHLMYGSIKVKVGDPVKRGQVVALCGNSGNSSEPHLHYHLQNTPVIQDGTGIKCYFQKVVVERNAKKETKTNYSPVKDDIVSPE